MNNESPKQHVTVLLSEAVEYLEVSPQQWYVDATFGGGGHTQAILDAGGNVIALDWDEEAVLTGNRKFEAEINQGSLILVHESFSHLNQVVTAQNREAVHGVLFDFGTSTNQLMSGQRGFSFAEDGELDMRMDTRLGVKAKDLLAIVPEKQLATLFWEYAGEEDAKRIAKSIKAAKAPITSTFQLRDLITSVKRGRTGKLHPATKVFQALRIAVNSELEEIATALPQALNVLAANCNVVTISFHEGEDRVAKTLFRKWEDEHLGTQLTGKPLTPGLEELNANPRARSAKLRAFKKSHYE